MKISDLTTALAYLEDEVGEDDPTLKLEIEHGEGKFGPWVEVSLDAGNGNKLTFCEGGVEIVVGGTSGDIYGATDPDDELEDTPEPQLAIMVE